MCLLVVEMVNKLDLYGWLGKVRIVYLCCNKGNFGSKVLSWVCYMLMIVDFFSNGIN